MTPRLEKALSGSMDTLHQRLFYGLCEDLTDLCQNRQNVVSVKAVLALVEQYQKADYNAH
jgi:hypothetical protein